MKFEIISQITHVEIIAKGTGVDIRHRLNQAYHRNLLHAEALATGKSMSSLVRE